MGCYDEKELARMEDDGWEMVTVVGTIDKWEFKFYTPADYAENNRRPKLSESTGASGEMKGYGGCSTYFKRPK